MISNPIIISHPDNLDNFLSGIISQFLLSHLIMIPFKKWAPEKPESSVCFMSGMFIVAEQLPQDHISIIMCFYADSKYQMKM